VDTADEQRIYAKLQTMENEIAELKTGYLLVNERYTNTLGVLKRLTSATLEAALRATAPRPSS
jgi:hypothetical protein